jgi:endonuclease-3
MNAAIILAKLKELYPNPRHYLNFDNNFELLVATILSAQCTDEVVNDTTKALFKKYKKPEDFENMPLAQIELDLSHITFFRNKARMIKDCCTILVEKHHAKVPGTIEELIKLPGLGRKSANSILSHGFDRVEGIIVDTHVIRLSQRLGWTKNKISDKIEKDLMLLFDKREWKWLPFYLKSHGKAVCKAPKPFCQECAVNKLCPSAFKF